MTKNYYKFLRGKLLFTLFSMCMLLGAQKGFGQIAAWNFFGESVQATSAADVFNANLVATSGANNMTRGAGAASSAGSNSFRTVGFQNNGISTANTDYFQITLTANTGFVLSLSTIDAKFAGTATFAASPGVSSQFAYSLDGTNFTLIGSPSVTIGTPATLTQINTSGISALQNVAAGTTVTLRYYASGQTTTGGWGFTSASAASINDGLSIGGSVSSAAVVPTVTTPTFANVTTIAADLGGNITSNGGASLTARGVVWSSINTNPTIGGANTTNVVDVGTGTGVFTTPVTGLPSGTLIYYKAYATNSVGTGYTSVDNFTTQTPLTPTLTVSATSPSFGNVCLNVQSSESSFTVSGINLTAGPVQVGPLANYQFSLTPGGPYNASENIPYTPPTLSSTIVYVVFTPTAVQSYNGNVPVSGGGDSKTSAVTGSGVDSAPTVGTFTSSSITNSTATAAGIISSIGCSALSTYGIEYSTTNGFLNGTGTPVTSTNLSGINFSSALTGLTSSTIYYYHAYASNSGGTNYGAQQSFTTTAMPAPVATAATNITTTSFDANWNAVTGATDYFLDVSQQSNFLDPTPINLVEFSFPTVGGDDNIADGGTGANSGATLITVGGTSTVTYNTSGATTNSARSTIWNSGSGTKYWETSINTQNYYNITVSSKQRSSNTGPRDFKLQYKIGAGGTYTDVPGGNILVADNYTSGVLNNLALPVACENQVSVFLRWIMTSNTSVNAATVVSGGAHNIDDIFVNGNAGDYVFGYENLPVGNVLTAQVTGLAGNTTYHYRVRSADAGSTSANSNTINVTTLDPCATLAVNPSNNGPICDGSTLNLFANPTGGTLPYSQFQWSGPGGFTAATQDVSFLNGVSGLYTVTVTDNIGCTVTANTSFVINPLPAINCSGPLNVNADAGLCTATISNAQLLNQVSDVVGTVSFSPAAGNFVVGTTLVTATSDNSCGTTSCSFNVIVADTQNPTITSCPPTANIAADAGLCTSSASIGTATATDNCAGATVSASPAGPYPVGTTTVTWTATDASGNTATCTQTVNVADTENPTIANCPSNITVSNESGICGAIVNYTAPTATDNCAGASLMGNHNSGDFFPIGTTTVTYTATDASNNTSTCSFTVTVNSTLPTAPTSVTTNAPFDNICLGNNVMLTANGGSLGNMGGNYKWYTGSCGGTLVGTGTSITQSPVVTTTYFVRVEDNCGNTTACASVNVTLSFIPDSANVILPFSGMPANICTGTTATLSIAPVAGATQYTWDVPSGGYFNGNPLNVSPFVTATPNVQVTYGAPIASLYTTGVQAGNACGNSFRKTQKTRGTTSIPASIAGSLTACANSSLTYSTAAVVGATSYLWSITGNATVSGSGNTVTVNFGSNWNGGTLCVSAQTTCFTSSAKCITISKSAAITNAISGTFTACPGSTLSYSVAPSAGAASYNWTVPSGSSVTNGQGTSAVVVTYGPTYNVVGSICVSVTSVCGVTSALKCKTVAPGLPSQPSSISGFTNGLCNQSAVYSCPSQGAGVTYNWTVPSGATILSGQGSTSINVLYGTFSTGSVCVTASNACGNSVPRCITVKGAPNSPGAITANPSTWCANASGIEFNANVASLTGIYSLNWTYPVAPVATYLLGGGNSTQLTMNWLTGTGNINVTASNSCGSGTRTSTWGNTCREGVTGTINQIAVSPNPASGIINITYTASKGNSILHVIDIAGRVVLTKTTTSVDGINYTQLDMSKLAKGAYMLSVQSTQGNKQLKVVVE